MSIKVARIVGIAAGGVSIVASLAQAWAGQKLMADTIVNTVKHDPTVKEAIIDVVGTVVNK